MNRDITVRLSRGRFTPEQHDAVRKLIEDSERSLTPAIEQLPGLLYYFASVDPVTNTVINMSIWSDLAAAKQMDSLAAMLAQRPILEAAGVRFDAIANYRPLWTIEHESPASPGS